jgi:hypothetical protein
VYIVSQLELAEAARRDLLSDGRGFVLQPALARLFAEGHDETILGLKNRGSDAELMKLGLPISTFTLIVRKELDHERTRPTWPVYRH